MRRLILLLALLAAAAGGYFWYDSRPRTLTVCVYTDALFRQRPDWQSVLKSRLDAVSNIYQQVRIRLQPIDLTRSDPTSLMADPDERRAVLARETGCPADLTLGITGQRTGIRTGSVTPFSHGALVVDERGQPEQHNILVLAHELAHLFGAAHDPGTDTLMAEKPVSPWFSPRTVRLIGHLRRYNFARGVEALDGSAGQRAFVAIRESLEDLSTTPDLQARMIVGAAAEADGAHAVAIHHFQEALKLNPKSESARYSLAISLERNLQDDAALALLREGVKINPESARLHGALGSAVLRLNREEAIDEFNTSLHLEPNNAPLLVTLGDVLSGGMGQVEPAIQAYKKALELIPNMAQAKKGLARLTSYQEKAQRDAEALRVTVAQNPDKASLLYRLGVAEARAGNLDAAIAELHRATTLEPQLGLAHSTLVQLYYLRGNFAEAWNEVSAAKAAGITPDAALIAALNRRMPHN